MKHIVNLLLALFLAACSSSTSDQQQDAEPPQAEVQTPANDWITLFDGSSTEGWRGFNMDSLPANWVIEEGTLKSLGTGGDIGGDIIYGAREFDNFELELEWKIAEGGNSGIFYHVVEDPKYDAPYETGPEYQLLDNLGFEQELMPEQMVAADYAMYAADYTNTEVKPSGEWNSTRIIYTPERVEHWLNGAKVVEFVPYSEDWMTLRNSGKWDDYPDYAIAKTGYIGIQDHGSFIWFRNIRIKAL